MTKVRERIMMSQLIVMRQRINAVKTIEKVTHAMRLIAMSVHSRLKTKRELLLAYQGEIQRLLVTLHQLSPHWHHPLLKPTTDTTERKLVLIIGSQKGLCGTFNSALMSRFEKFDAQHDGTFDIISVGKKITDYLNLQLTNAHRIVAAYDNFTVNTLVPIAQQLIAELLEAHPHYSTVTVIANEPTTFFIQRPRVMPLIPFEHKTTAHDEHEAYHLEQQPEVLLKALAERALTTKLEVILFDSLMAEHAARFVSMDNATRNAENILERMQLEYNKTRQAKITKELTELSGAFMINKF